jgi:hypothetical protein
VTDELDLRASDAERERVAASLREHCAAGRLRLEELSERLDEAYRSRTGGVDEHGADTPPQPASPLVRVRSLALLGGADVWRVPRGAKELSQGDMAS